MIARFFGGFAPFFVSQQTPATPVLFWSGSILDLENEAAINCTHHGSGRRNCVGSGKVSVIAIVDFRVVAPFSDVELNVLKLRVVLKPKTDLLNIFFVNR